MQGHAILAQVDALFTSELVGDPVEDALVEVIAAQEGIAVGGLDLEHAVADVQDRDVKGATAQVVDRDTLLDVLVQAIGQSGGRRLVDDAQNLQAGNTACVLGGLALAVVEVGRHGNDGLGHRLAQILLGVVLELLQDHCRDLGRRVVLATHDHGGVAVGALDDFVGQDLDRFLHLCIGELAAHQALHREDRIVRIGDCLPARHLADEALA